MRWALPASVRIASWSNLLQKFHIMPNDKDEVFISWTKFGGQWLYFPPYILLESGFSEKNILILYSIP